jgi:hypothetical protein
MKPMPDDLDCYISLNPEGGIVTQTILKNQMSQDDLDLLHSVIEDNVVEYDDPETMEWREKIDWAGVERDWREMMNEEVK